MPGITQQSTQQQRNKKRRFFNFLHKQIHPKSDSLLEMTTEKDCICLVFGLKTIGNYNILQGNLSGPRPSRFCSFADCDKHRDDVIFR